MSKIRVLVAFEFDYIDPNSPGEEALIEDITEECETMQIAFDAQSCYVQDVTYPEREARRLNSQTIDQVVANIAQSLKGA